MFQNAANKDDRQTHVYITTTCGPQVGRTAKQSMMKRNAFYGLLLPENREHDSEHCVNLLEAF